MEWARTPPRLCELSGNYLPVSAHLSDLQPTDESIAFDYFSLTAAYHSGGIPCAGKQVYAPRHCAAWLAKITEVGVLRRAEFYYQQLDALRVLRQAVRRDLLTESKKHQPTTAGCKCTIHC
jgi:hypothetical protein